MNGEVNAPKPWVSHVTSWLVLASSILYPFSNRASASSASTAPAHEPQQHQSPPDKSTQRDSGQPPQPIIPSDQSLLREEIQASIEARNNLVLASAASLDPIDQASTAAPPGDGFDDQPHCPAKHSPNSPDTKADQARVTLITSERKSESQEPILSVIEIIDKQELGKHILGLTIPMAMGLVFSISPLATSFEMHVVAIALSLALAAIWNGILLRKAYPRASTLILVAGISLITFAFYVFVICFLPLKFKWIPALCWLATLFPLATFLVAYLRSAGEEKDLEKGQTY